MLRNVISKSGETQAVWAQRIGISEAYLSNLLSGNAVPSLSVAVKIERLTKGIVSASSWVPDVANPQTKEEAA